MESGNGSSKGLKDRCIDGSCMSEKSKIAVPSRSAVAGVAGVNKQSAGAGAEIADGGDEAGSIKMFLESWPVGTVAAVACGIQGAAVASRRSLLSKDEVRVGTSRAV